VAAERASQTVVEVLAEWFGDVPDQPEIAWVRLTRRLRHALYAAHDELGEVLGQPPARSAVGSVGAATAVALIRARHLLTADVGGRAVFLLRGGELQGLAASDSSPPEMLTGEAAAARRLGASRPLLGCSQLGPDLWIRRYPLRPGDRLLLASRGVTDVLAAEELAAVLSGAASAVEVADELTELALEAGAHEDATCIVLDVVRA
jgi:protein phosphatase